MPHTHIVQDVSGKRPELLCSFDQPLQDGLGRPRNPCGASDAHTFGQAREDAHDELDRGALAMKDRTKGLEKIAATGDTQQLSPGTTIGMAIGAEIPPGDPTPIRTVRVRAEMAGGVDLTTAPSREHDVGWRDCGCLGVRGAAGCTGVAVRLGGEPLKRLGPRVALWR